VKKLFSSTANKAMTLSVSMALLLLVGKIFAYLLTQSAAVFADAFEAIGHLFTTLISAFSLWYARQPPDKEHPYGHGKIVYFSAACEGMFIAAASVVIFIVSIEHLLYHEQVDSPLVGLSILVPLVLLNLALGFYLLYAGRKQNSLVLKANGVHTLSDVWMNIGVILSLLLVKLTGIYWLDPLVGMLVGGYILITAIRLLVSAYRGLVERACDEVGATIMSILHLARRDGLIIDFHELTFRKVDHKLWIEVHLLFAESISLKEAHSKTCEVEILLKKEFPKEQLWITTHLEPDSHDDSHPKGHPELDRNLS
jgi:cation diffusion facilitator family transporter